MIALSINEILWEELSKDPAFVARYDKYKTQLGDDFKPFFPVQDNHSGDISWDTEPYFLYDTVSLPPNRDVFGERYEQVLYTLVGQIQDIFELRDKVIKMFSYWDDAANPDPYGLYRITNLDVWQPLRTRGRDSIRQNYSVELLVNVNYLLCGTDKL